MGSLDADWLRARVEAGATAKEIAAEAGCSPRTVHNWLHRYKIPLPREHRDRQVDWNAVLAEYRSGVPIMRIAARHGVSTDWVEARLKVQARPR